MAPSAIQPSAQGTELQDAVPPPKLYPPREAHFEKYIEPKSDGYRKAKSRGSGKAAIVIDNGIHALRTHSVMTEADLGSRFMGHQSWMVFRRLAQIEYHAYFLQI